jgi:hypothetical protein
MTDRIRIVGGPANEDVALRVQRHVIPHVLGVCLHHAYALDQYPIDPKGIVKGTVRVELDEQQPVRLIVRCTSGKEDLPLRGQYG